MQPVSTSQVTPQGKMVGINNKFGNRGIKKQQGTTRVIYDTLTLDSTATTFRFFENVNNRTFPQTNVGQSGTGLQVGESLSIDRMYLSLVQLTAVTFVIIDMVSLITRVDIEIGDVSIKIANTVVLKPIPLSSFNRFFNKSAKHTLYSVFEFDTSIIIPPLLEFVAEVRTTIAAATPLFDLRLTLEGVGSILAPRATF